MTRYTMTFEDKANGAAIANGAYGSYTVQMGSGSTLVADNTHVASGSIAAKVTPAASQPAQIASPTLSTSTLAVRMPIYLTAEPADELWFAAFYNGSTRLVSLVTTGAGAVRIYAGGSYLWTAGSALTLNQWNYLNLYATAGTTGTDGTIRATVDTGDPSSPVFDSGTLTGKNTGTVGSFTSARLVKANASSYATAFWLDDTTIDDAATGIITTLAAPTASVTATSPVALVDATGSTGTGLTYAITQVSGPSGTATPLVTPGRWYVTVSTGADAVWRVTVTQSDGQTASHDFTIAAATGGAGADVLRWDGTIWG